MSDEKFLHLSDGGYMPNITSVHQAPSTAGEMTLMRHSLKVGENPKRAVHAVRHSMYSKKMVLDVK